jgi:hypothetical protein
MINTAPCISWREKPNSPLHAAPEVKHGSVVCAVANAPSDWPHGVTISEALGAQEVNFVSRDGTRVSR